MMRCLTLVLLIPTLASGQATDKEGKEVKRPPEKTPVVRLAPHDARGPNFPVGAGLLPDPVDLIEGNAAPLWVRAAAAYAEVRHKWTDAQEDWRGTSRVALKDLPTKDVRDLLKKYALASRLADQAARRKHCNWGGPPLLVSNVGDLPLTELQGLRELARLLDLRCRLEMAEGQFDKALVTLQTFLALGRHTTSDELLIRDLVGIAISAVCLSRVEEWTQTPGSPNLYWALTELPRPFVDTRRSMRNEFGTLYRSYPLLSEMKTKKLSDAAMTALIDQIGSDFSLLGINQAAIALTTAGKNEELYQASLKELKATGRAEKDLLALPKTQVVILNYVLKYDAARDGALRAMALPSWQAWRRLEKVDAQYLPKAKKDGNVLVSLFFPTIAKVAHAELRLELTIAGLRGAEALRAHTAEHGGPPAKWADLTETPGPVDPVTGRGLDSYYSLKDGKAVLDIPPPPHMPPLLGRRFELAIK